MPQITCPKCGAVHPASRTAVIEDSFTLRCHSCGTKMVGTVRGGAVDADSAEGRTIQNMMSIFGDQGTPWDRR